MWFAVGLGLVGLFYGFAWLVAGDPERCTYGRIAGVTLLISSYLLSTL